MFILGTIFFAAIGIVLIFLGGYMSRKKKERNQVPFPVILGLVCIFLSLWIWGLGSNARSAADMCVQTVARTLDLETADFTAIYEAKNNFLHSAVPSSQRGLWYYQASSACLETLRETSDKLKYGV